MKSSYSKTRFSKKSKHKQKNKPNPVTQDDYYLEAIDFEEQAERWLLSDIKKSLRFYMKAFQMYEIGLTAPQSTDKGTYNILYNETRLLLQLYSDYMANNGYINLLQYITLDDIPNVEVILKPINEIIERFETVLQNYQSMDTWDLQSNLLTSYLLLIENYDKYHLNSGQIMDLANKFFTLSHELVLHQLESIGNGGNVVGNNTVLYGEDSNAFISIDDEKVNYTGDTLEMESRDGFGIKINKQHSNKEELVEVSDEITPESLFDVIMMCLKFNQALLEIMIDTKLGTGDQLLNVIQLNYLEDITNKQILTVDDIIETHKEVLTFKISDINLARYAVKGVQLLYSDPNVENLITYLETNPDPHISLVDLYLVKIDLFELAIDYVPDDLLDLKWNLCTQLNHLLTSTRNELNGKRKNLMVSHDQFELANLSNVVFQLCDVTIAAASNELRRYNIKARMNESTANLCNVQSILLKNVKTLLTNAQVIAEKSCGMQETIVDKLKRNYIYNEAKDKLAALPTNEKLT